MKFGLLMLCVLFMLAIFLCMSHGVSFDEKTSIESAAKWSLQSNTASEARVIEALGSRKDASPYTGVVLVDDADVEFLDSARAADIWKSAGEHGFGFVICHGCSRIFYTEKLLGVYWTRVRIY